MAVRVRCITDPACVWSWAFEPVVRALMTEFGDELEWTFVMGGLARQYGPDAREAMVHHWLDATAESGMPTDARVWFEAPLDSTYPACMAVKAAQEQGPGAGHRYLRALRQGIMARRRKLDGRDARWTCGTRPLDYVRAKAHAAGARPQADPRPSPLEAIQRFGRMAAVEMAAVCDLPLPRVEAELAQLALDRHVRPIPVLAGRLWEAA